MSGPCRVDVREPGTDASAAFADNPYASHLLPSLLARAPGGILPTVRPKKKWGQNFLRNRGAVEKIVAAVEAIPGETIVEIGPGEGVLTERLAALGIPFTAIEIDPELAEKLRARFGDVIVNGD